MLQPSPQPNNHALVRDAVIYDIMDICDRRYKKYGTHLQPYNGRDALVDLYEELIDAALYLRQVIAERDLYDKEQA